MFIAATREPPTEVITRVERSTTTQIITMPRAPLLVVMPAPPVTTAVETRACPTPRTDAPRLVPPDLPEPVTDLAVSPTNAGWIAAWNDEHVFVSIDAGRTFQRRLDGIGVVHAVQFDCFGHVVVARGERIGIADGARESWHALAGLDLAVQGSGDDVWRPNVEVIGGGRDVIVVGRSARDARVARVAVSRDRAASWTYHDMGEYSGASEYAAGLQRTDGSIVVGVVIPDCMTEHLSWIEIAADGSVKNHELQIYGVPFQLWGDSITTAYARRKMSAPDDAKWTLAGDNEYWGTPIPAPYPVFVNETRAARLVGKTLRDYPWLLEGNHKQMDPAGRLWSVACGRLWIARKDRLSGYCD